MAHVPAPGFGDSPILEDLLRGGYVVARGLTSAAGIPLLPPLPPEKRERKRRPRRPKATRPQLRRRARRQTRPATRRIARQGAREVAAIQRQGAGLQRKVTRATSSATRTVRSTPTFGLQGRAARQVQQEIKGQTGDIRAFGRAQSRGASQLTRQAIAGSRAGTQQAISDKRFSRFESLLGQQRTQQRELRQGKRQRQGEAVNALNTAVRLMSDPEFQEETHEFEPEQKWAALEQAISGEGVSPEVGRKVAAAIRRRVEVTGVPGLTDANPLDAASFLLERGRITGHQPRRKPQSGVPGLDDIASFLLERARESARKAAR